MKESDVLGMWVKVSEMGVVLLWSGSVVAASHGQEQARACSGGCGGAAVTSALAAWAPELTAAVT